MFGDTLPARNKASFIILIYPTFYMYMKSGSPLCVEFFCNMDAFTIILTHYFILVIQTQRICILYLVAN